jgi:site-specific DNA-methyltransferase (adenine-specific)
LCDRRYTQSERADDISEEEWLALSYRPWTFSGESRPWEAFPASFPLELPRRLIRYLSPIGATVLDPCVGSGTTVLAAVQLGRQAVGFDRSPTYIESSKRRLVAALGDEQTGGGQP